MKATTAVLALLMAIHTSIARSASLPVVVEILNNAAKACAVSESQLEGVALRTLENSPLQPDTNAGGWLSIRVTVSQKRRNPCLAHISVQMKAFAKSLRSARVATSKQRPRAPDVVLCNKSDDYSAAQDTFLLGVESAVEHSINRCLRSLKY